ncbi:TonB-dependent receptor [Sphingomonas hengshuiensis]|uniref:TonB-dependent receptor n=1 Tax=Sphingomonas hengshuiensis TaxID=1609977 RepID=A0A7U4J828_9SPHN|nr:TonB-dependent receptor [Sphingomonas hengshuiensis]AJP71976.1 TonB-dependent receptor [Sphingomonas hengshuiensis]
MKSKTTRYLLASTLLMGMPLAAHAQDSSAQDDASSEILVTGSRLSNPNLGAAPVTVVTADEILLSGQVNIENILKEQPQLVPSLTSASNNPGGGVSTADLRGLGAERTLVLVNGRRYVSYDSTQIVDLNTIPAALLEQVQVLTGGSSAVYGSDAVSGVVNFITKQDFQGIRADANYRITGEGDGATFNTNLLVGTNFADGRGNITLYGDYTKRNGIVQGDRAYSSSAQTDDGEGGLVAGGSGSIPGTRFAIAGVQRKFETDGSYSAYTSPGDLYNYAPDNYLQVPQERYLLSGQAHFKASDHLELYAEGQFIHNKVKNQLAATPFTGSVQLDTDSSFLSASSQALLQAADTDGDGYATASIYRRMNEVGPRISDLDSKAYRGVFGVRGQITGDWNYDAYFSYARTEQVENQIGNVSRSRMLQALKTSYDSSGNLVCSDTSNGCVPINIFGAGNVSDAAASFVAITTRNASTITEKVVSGAITNNNLFDLGAGAAKIAVGAEYRDEYGSYNPDAALSSGDVVGFNASEGLSGGYNVKELFSEILVPLIADKPFIKMLEFSGSYRYSYYSTAAKSVNTFSGGLVWTPVDDISFRGKFSRAVRAPTVSNLYSGASQDYPTATDPCTLKDEVTNSSLAAQCVATGVPTSALGTSYDGGSTQIESVTGGSTSLREETANTYTLGVVLQPRVLPRFSLTIDYYRVKVDNYIRRTGTANIVRACYGDANNGWVGYDTSYCGLLPRDTNSYAITGAVDYLTNTGGMKSRGIDFEARYSVPLAFGLDSDSSTLALRLSGTRLLAWEYTPIAGLSAMKTDCAGKFGVTCGNPYAKLRLSGRATWDAGSTRLSVAYRHLSGVNDDDDTTAYTVERIKAYDYFDLSAAFDIAKAFTWTMGVNNLFDRQPPILGDNQQQANTYPSTYDPYGRTFFTGVSLKF